jgi:hypothetical protein
MFASAGAARVFGLLVAIAIASRTASVAADEPATPPQDGHPAQATRIGFNRDVRPILSATCFQCHGPDQHARKADLRLDVRDIAIADRGGYAAILPGNSGASALVARINSADPDERMPPSASHRALSAAQIATLTRWVEEGAEYEPHWSLVAPQRPPLPEVHAAAWVRNGIDSFVLGRLEQEGLKPLPEADRETLLRRVTLDLTGLPPSIVEIDAFLLDNRRDAYERVVNRLLESPRYGERMAVPWLDAARYADTHGYQDDGMRHMWRWRDWVIDAFNNNMPFDRFTIAQLAGDLLPEATVDDRIATGFNRNHRGNSEGGIIPEEYLVEYAVDRVETTTTVWLGLTMGCARCHDHKFDPVTQREFYQVLGYFNNIPEMGRVLKHGNSPPVVRAPTRPEQERMAEIERDLAAAESAFATLEPELAAAQSAWEAALDKSAQLDWSYRDGLTVHFPFNGDVKNVIDEKAVSKVLEGDPEFAPGIDGQALDLDGQRYIDAGDLANYGEVDKFSYGAWVLPRGDAGGTVISRIDDDKLYEGYDLLLADGKARVYMGNRTVDDSIQVETADAITPDAWHHLMVTYDGSRVAKGVKIFVDARETALVVHKDLLNNAVRTTQPLRIGSRSSSDRFHGLIDEVRFYSHDLSPEEVAALASVEPINRLAQIAPTDRSLPQAARLRLYYILQGAPEAMRQAFVRLADLRRERRKLEEAMPTVMIMEEQNPPKETFVLVRGEYDKPGERVKRGLPTCLPPLPEGAPNDRLGFARWLVDPRNPLCARVTVNRFWQLFFGSGLVRTAEDFGSQGELPSHPELLDWLATQFIRTGWDVKALVKLIATSATYRQSSQVNARLTAVDPDNRLLAHGPRFRLAAGTIRDSALAAAGLLVESVGGPSVRPYQPAGLWEELTAHKYEQDHGESLYRRSMYTFWKRTIAPPAMMTFDAASRETCIVRPQRTNTPLQALATLNDITYVEAARGLAKRMLLEGGGKSPRERIILAFRLATGRRPRTDELHVLLAGLETQLSHYAANPAAADELIGVGESPRDERLQTIEWAAYTNIASVILNLDEALTKE